jgi:3-dehydroshikimate dehydratase
MIALSAFADEISPDLDEQLAVLRVEGLRYLDLRSVWQTNVLDLSEQQLSLVRDRLRADGIAVSSIASPIGKVPIDASFDEHVDHFERALRLARFFETPYLRLFSFYPAAGTHDPPDREAVLYRLRELTARARAAAITLLHENEKGIFGDTAARCLELLNGVHDSRFQAVFDPANFIQCGEEPFPWAFQLLRPWLRYVHVKDARTDGTVVPVGEGVANWPSILEQLRATGYEGFLSLEPHLAEASQFGGFSGAERFHHAAEALKALLSNLGWEYR